MAREVRAMSSAEAVPFKVPASRAFGALASKLAARAPELAIYEASELKLR